MEIIRQHTDYQRSEALVTDNIVIYHLFGEYIVQVFRKVDKPGEAIQHNNFRQFTDIKDAIEHFDKLVKNWRLR